MRNNLIILKLGGSVITEKDKPLTPNLQVIERLAGEISKANFKPLIIVHGGGSYGHPLAKKYGIAEGFRDHSQIYGFSRTHEAMISLNRLLVKSLLKYSLPAFSVSPSSFIMTEDGRIQTFNDEILKAALRLDLVPVLYGDAVLDTKRGFTILSGDQIISALAIKLRAEKIIMGIDVDGLYDSDPKKNPSAQLINEASLKDLTEMIQNIGGSSAPDVTGGMLGKILELQAAVENGVETLIINALKPNNLYKALKGEVVIGTRIRR